MEKNIQEKEESEGKKEEEEKKEEREGEKKQNTNQQSEKRVEKYSAKKWAWKRSLSEEELTLKQFQVKITKGLKLVPLGIRLAKYVAKVRKEGKEPYMDPFLDEEVFSNRGVPCGGLGAGSITRSWKGEFNHFYMQPGRVQPHPIKANQFSLFLRRDGLPSSAFVLGRPYKHDLPKPSSSSSSSPSSPFLPSLEPLPDDIASFLDSLPTDDISLDSSDEPLSDEPSPHSNHNDHDNNNDNNNGENHNNDNDDDGEKKKKKGRARLAEILGRDLRGKRKGKNTQRRKINKKTTYITPEEALGEWEWREMKGEYAGLFPRAWTEYDLEGVDKKLKVSCMQISPVIPDNYKESSYPVCVFAWHLSNTHPSSSVDVSLMFTFQNGIGKGSDYSGGHYNLPFTPSPSSSAVGVEMVYNHLSKPSSSSPDPFLLPLSLAIASSPAHFHSLPPDDDDDGDDDGNEGEDGEDEWKEGEEDRERNEIDSIVRFETTGRGREVWEGFAREGRARVGERQGNMKSQSEKGVGIGGAVSNYVKLLPRQSATVCFALGWDQPLLQFGSGRAFYPRYTRYYGRGGGAVQALCRDALRDWRHWNHLIDQWQRPILSNPLLPSHYKSALFNELYYLVAGGTVWIDEEEDEQAREKRRLPSPPSSSSPSSSSTPSSKAQEEKEAKKVGLDYMALTARLEEGLMVYDDRSHSTGRIIFSLDDLLPDVTYYTSLGNPLTRFSNQQVSLSSILLRPPSSPSSSPSSSPPSSDIHHHPHIDNNITDIITNNIDNDNNNDNKIGENKIEINMNGNYNEENDVGDIDENNKIENEIRKEEIEEKEEIKMEEIKEGEEEKEGERKEEEEKEKEKEKEEKVKEEKVEISAEYGQLLYLEGQEYLMYNTYDVHFYASFALISLWPELELSMQRDIGRSALKHAPSDLVYTLQAGELKPRKLRGAIPHDVGSPSDDPLYQLNAYNIHDVNEWKDLNSKFALQVYRDYVATGDVQFLHDMWPVVWETMHYLERSDRNRDGMIENGGRADQTYDAWPVEGTSAYCGSLWIAALAATAHMADLLHLPDDVAYFQSLLLKAQEVFEKQLWNGVYYKYDDSGRRDDVIMSDQLVGDWYSRASLLPPLFPPDHVSSALQTIYNYNYKMFKGGSLGVVNGFKYRARQVDYSSLQSCEVWVGTGYALVANMIQQGMEEQGWEIFNSLYDCIYHRLGYWFQTPEAWDDHGRYRSYAYMRPLSIWSIHWALLHRPLLSSSLPPSQLLPHLNPSSLSPPPRPFVPLHLQSPSSSSLSKPSPPSKPLPSPPSSLPPSSQIEPTPGDHSPYNHSNDQSLSDDHSNHHSNDQSLSNQPDDQSLSLSMESTNGVQGDQSLSSSGLSLSSDDSPIEFDGNEVEQLRINPLSPPSDLNSSLPLSN